jgi:FlaA1/EpsC-like NDP-sugar epimerase
MRSPISLFSKFFPLFLGVICTYWLVLALVPGRLEDHTSNLLLSLLIFLVIPPISLGIFGWAIYEIIRVFRDKQKYLNILKSSGVISLLILLFTSCLLFFNIPARLYFYTSNQQFQQVLDRQILSNGNYQNIKKIGNFKIAEIVVDRRVGGSTKDKPVYFITRNIAFIDVDRYGFAYLPDRSQTFASQTTHIYGKWYVFFQAG